MMTLLFNTKKLLEENNLGVVYRGKEPVVLSTQGKTKAIIEPNVAYRVVFLSFEREGGVMLLNDTNGVVFSFHQDELEFIDLTSREIN